MDMTRSLREVDLAVKTARYYFENGMEKKSKQELLNKENLAKISAYYYKVKNKCAKFSAHLLTTL